MRVRTGAVAAALLGAAAPALGVPLVVVPAVDYPAGVTPGPEERVTAVVTFGGKVERTNCRIVRRSHVPALDMATCDILRTRGRFAMKGGQPIEFSWAASPAPDSPEPHARRGDPLYILGPSGFVTKDYPVEAARQGQQGNVGFDVDVSATGRPLACRIATSSGWPLLDSATCRRAIQRTLYIPAIDLLGRPAEGTYHGWLAWRIQG